MTEDNIVEFTGLTKADIPANKVIKWADNLDEAIVVGIDELGELYVAGSMADAARVVYLLEMAKKYILDLGEEYDI